MKVTFYMYLSYQSGGLSEGMETIHANSFANESPFYPQRCQHHSRDKDNFLSSPTPSSLLAARWSWRGAWQGREVVFGRDTFREGQTVTLRQPGRTRGTATLNTISWSANGREFVVVFGGYVFVCVPWCALKCVCVSALVHIYVLVLPCA